MATGAGRKKRDADYVFYELTRSVCPKCLETIDAQILIKDGRVVMRKRCPDHGWSEALISSDAEMYLGSLRYNKPGTMPLGYSTEVVDGCPKDCGLCPEHKQHTCPGAYRGEQPLQPRLPGLLRRRAAGVQPVDATGREDAEQVHLARGRAGGGAIQRR